MIPLLLSIGLGIGVYLIYDSLTNPSPAPLRLPRLRGLEDFLQRAGLREVTPRDFLLFSLGTGLGVALLAQLVLGWVLVSLLLGAVGALLPAAYYAHRGERRRAVLQEGLAEAMAQLRDAIRAGLSVQEGLAALARTGPEALRPEFAALVRDTRLMRFEEALIASRERLADPLFDTAAATLLLNDRVGGRHLSTVLDRLVQATRAELRVQQELRAYQARTVMSARVVAAVPVVLLLIIRAINPQYLSVFNDWSGQLILLGCACSLLIGYAAMLWMTRLPGERRVLVR